MHVRFNHRILTICHVCTSANATQALHVLAQCLLSCYKLAFAIRLRIGMREAKRCCVRGNGMADRLRVVVALLRSNVTNLCVFAVLGVTLYLGHHFDWKLPKTSSTSEAAPANAEARGTPTPKLPMPKPSMPAVDGKPA